MSIRNCLKPLLWKGFLYTNNLKYKDVVLKIDNYAKFLKKPLSLGMFVPFDENGNVLTQCEEICACECDKIKNYRKAKEKVIFENCVVISNSIIKVGIAYLDFDNLKINTIEDLIGLNLDCAVSF